MHSQYGKQHRASTKKLQIELPYDLGFPGGAVIKESACQCRGCRRHRFDPWVGKIPWRRKWQPTPLFLSGKSINRGTWRATVHGIAKSQTDLATKQQHDHQGEFIQASLTQVLRTIEASTSVVLVGPAQPSCSKNLVKSVEKEPHPLITLNI